MSVRGAASVRDAGSVRAAASVRGAALAVALVVLMAAGAVAVPASALWARRTADADRERLTAVAAEVAVLMSSLSDGDPEATLDRLTELGTGGFREEVTARREEVLRLVGSGDGGPGGAGGGGAGGGGAGGGGAGDVDGRGDDDEARPGARVVACGVEQEDLPGGIGDDPARARVLVAVRTGEGDAGGAGARARTPGAVAGGERLWRWRIEAVIEDGRALVDSAEVAV